MFIVSTPSVCFSTAGSSHVSLDRTQHGNGHARMILGNPAMINTYKFGPKCEVYAQDPASRWKAAQLMQQLRIGGHLEALPGAEVPQCFGTAAGIANLLLRHQPVGIRIATRALRRWRI